MSELENGEVPEAEDADGGKVQADRIERVNLFEMGRVENAYIGETVDSSLKDAISKMELDVRDDVIFGPIDEFSKYFSLLKEHKILFVSCFDEEIQKSLHLRLLNQLQGVHPDTSVNSGTISEEMFKAIENDQAATSTSIAPSIFFEKLSQKRIQRKNEILLLYVKIDNQHSDFFQPILKKDNFRAIRTCLKEKDAYWVFYLSSENQIQQIENLDLKKGNEITNLFWEVPFLRYRLRNYLKQESEIQQCLSRVKEQIKQGHWPKDRKEFHKEVFSLTQNGISRFLSELKKREDQNKLEQEKETEIQKVQKLFKKKKGIIYKTVIYTGVYFPGLKIREFRFLVGKLLEGEVIRSKKEIFKKTKKGKSKLLGLEEELIDAQAFWLANVDEILPKSLLQPTYTESNQQTIEFPNSYLRETIRMYMEQRMTSFLHQQFHKLFEPVFISSESTRAIIDNFIQLTLGLTKQDPEYFGLQVLDYLAKEIDRLTEYIQAMELEEMLKFLMKIDSQASIQDLQHPNREKDIKNLIFKTRNHVYRGLVLLLRAAQKSTDFSHVLQQFFNTLISRRKSHLALRLIKQSNDTEAFDKDYWLRQTLFRGDTNCRKDTYEYLLIGVLNYEENPIEFLQKFYSWIPQNIPQGGDDESLRYYLLMFAFHYSILTFGTIQPDADFGKEPSKYRLFLELEKQPEPDAIFTFLFRWIFHQDMQSDYFYIDSTKDYEIDEIHSRGVLLEKWYLILRGFESESHTLLPVFLEALVAFLDESPAARKQVRNDLRRQKAFYMKQIERFVIKEKEQRNQIRRRRRSLTEFQKAIQPQ